MQYEASEETETSRAKSLSHRAKHARGERKRGEKRETVKERKSVSARVCVCVRKREERERERDGGREREWRVCE